MKPFIIEVELYNHDIGFLLCSEKKAKKWLKSKVKEGFLSKDVLKVFKKDKRSAYGLTFMKDGEPTIIFIPDFGFTAREFGTLSHEIFHACENLLFRVGVDLVKESEEAYAYLIGFVTSKVFEKLENNKDERK